MTAIRSDPDEDEGPAPQRHQPHVDELRDRLARDQQEHHEPGETGTPGGEALPDRVRGERDEHGHSRERCGDPEHQRPGEQRRRPLGAIGRVAAHGDRQPERRQVADEHAGAEERRGAADVLGGGALRDQQPEDEAPERDDSVAARSHAEPPSMWAWSRRRPLRIAIGPGIGSEPARRERPNPLRERERRQRGRAPRSRAREPSLPTVGPRSARGPAWRAGRRREGRRPSSGAR